MYGLVGVTSHHYRHTTTMENRTHAYLRLGLTQDKNLDVGKEAFLGEAGRVRWDQTLPPCAKWAAFRRLHSRHITCLALPHPLFRDANHDHFW